MTLNSPADDQVHGEYLLDDDKSLMRVCVLIGSHIVDIFSQESLSNVGFNQVSHLLESVFEGDSGVVGSPLKEEIETDLPDVVEDAYILSSEFDFILVISLYKFYSLI